MATERARNLQLDGWRGLAILGVLIGHFVTARGMNLGRVGVELFYALSGSLIGQLLFLKQEPLASFAAKRFARIVPSMWVLCVVAMGVEQVRTGQLPASFASAALGIANYLPPPARVDHLWSVAVELQGYLALGLVAFVCRRMQWRPHAVLLPIIALSWLLTAATALARQDEYFSTYWRFEYRLTAMLGAAALMSYGAERLRPLPSWWICTLLGVSLQLNPVPDAIKYTLGSLLIAIGCVKLREASAPWLTNRALVFFGTVSFSVYLWQQLFFVEVTQLGRPFALALAVALGIGAHFLWDDRLHQACKRALSGRVRSNPAPANGSGRC